MVFFKWSDDLDVGNAFIDDDHRHLIALLNMVSFAIKSGKGKLVLGALLSDLIQYTQEHFKREEAVMRNIHYREFLEHKAEHEKLIFEVLVLQKKYANGDVDLVAD